VGSRPDIHLRCEGFYTPTQGRQFQRSVSYICLGFLPTGSHVIAETMLKVPLPVRTNNYKPSKPVLCLSQTRPYISIILLLCLHSCYCVFVDLLTSIFQFTSVNKTTTTAGTPILKLNSRNDTCIIKLL
jgi:hypothetical protein